jgi:NADH pyrophosphatase NudC (nudix superfamily)
LFSGIFPQNGIINIDPNEVEQAKFVTREEVAQMEEEGIIDYHTVETLEKFWG